MKRWALPAVAALALAGCQPEAGGLSAAAERQCLAEGGHVATAGLSGESFCARPAPDAGKACRAAGDCTGFCEPETRTCSADLVRFGCYSFLDADGREAQLCAD